MITTDLNLIKQQLEQGDVVGIPTETVYGLAANIFNEQAISTIFSTKKRPQTNPRIVHVHSLEKAKEVAAHFPPKAE